MESGGSANSSFMEFTDSKLTAIEYNFTTFPITFVLGIVSVYPRLERTASIIPRLVVWWRFQSVAFRVDGGRQSTELTCWLDKNEYFHFILFLSSFFYLTYLFVSMWP